METGQSLNSLAAINPGSVVAPEIFLALALLTMGIAKDRHANGGEVVEFVEQINGEKCRRFVFVFDPKGTDGVDTKTWMSRWNDEVWLKANPGHPLAAYRALARTYTDFAKWMKEHDPVLVFRGASVAGAEGKRQRIAYIPRSLMDTDRGREILKKAGIE